MTYKQFPVYEQGTGLIGVNQDYTIYIYNIVLGYGAGHSR